MERKAKYTKEQKVQVCEEVYFKHKFDTNLT